MALSSTASPSCPSPGSTGVRPSLQSTAESALLKPQEESTWSLSGWLSWDPAAHWPLHWPLRPLASLPPTTVYAPSCSLTGTRAGPLTCPASEVPGLLEEEEGRGSRPPQPVGGPPSSLRKRSSVGGGPGGRAGAQEPRREDKAGAGGGRDTGEGRGDSRREEKSSVRGKASSKTASTTVRPSDSRHSLSFPGWGGGLWPLTEIVL